MWNLNFWLIKQSFNFCSWILSGNLSKTVCEVDSYKIRHCGKGLPSITHCLSSAYNYWTSAIRRYRSKSSPIQRHLTPHVEVEILYFWKEILNSKTCNVLCLWVLKNQNLATSEVECLTTQNILFSECKNSELSNGMSNVSHNDIERK